MRGAVKRVAGQLGHRMEWMRQRDSTERLRVFGEALRFWGVGWVEGPCVGVEAVGGSVFGRRRTLEGLDGEGCYLFAVVVAAR